MVGHGGPGVDLEALVSFHGHWCPGLILGVHAASLALQHVGANSAEHEVMARVETDMCGVDAIQFMTGCTFGKGNLQHLDHGKNAYSFFSLADGRAIRVVARPDGWARDPEHVSLQAKVRAGQATVEEKQRFAVLHVAESHRLLGYSPEDLFEVQQLDEPPPHRERFMASMRCDGCGEAVAPHRVHHTPDGVRCRACIGEASQESDA